MAAEEKELWTRLVFANAGYGPAEAWTKEPVDSVADAIRKRHPIRIENGEYIHPDMISRFFPYSLWLEKEAERDKRHREYLAKTEAAKAKFGTKKSWFHRMLGA
jgi:hypothetical protein